MYLSLLDLTLSKFIKQLTFLLLNLTLKPYPSFIIIKNSKRQIFSVEYLPLRFLSVSQSRLDRFRD